MDIVYKCIVGSTLHGLRTPTSDIDIRYVYMDDLKEVLSPFKVDSFKVKDSDNEDEGWSFLHYCKLCAKCNPTGLEVLWSNQFISSEVFDLFKDNRKYFLDSSLVRLAHIGYAKCQIGRYLELPSRDPKCWENPSWLKRVPKAVVSGYRVLDQGKQLLYKKGFNPEVDPELAKFLMKVKTFPTEEINSTWLDEHKDRLNDLITRLDNIKSNYTQDLNFIEKLLLRAYTDRSLSKELYGSCEGL